MAAIPMLLACLFQLYVSTTNIGQHRDADDDARHRKAAIGTGVSVSFGGIGAGAAYLSAPIWVPATALTISVGALIYSVYQLQTRIRL